MPTQVEELEEIANKSRSTSPGERLAIILEIASRSGITKSEAKLYKQKNSGNPIEVLIELNLLTTDEQTFRDGASYHPTEAYSGLNKEHLVYALDIMRAKNRDPGKKEKRSRYLVEIAFLSELETDDESPKSAVVLAKNNFERRDRADNLLGEFVEKGYALKHEQGKDPTYSITPQGKELLKGVYEIVQNLKAEKERLATMHLGIFFGKY